MKICCLKTYIYSDQDIDLLGIILFYKLHTSMKYSKVFSLVFELFENQNFTREGKKKVKICERIKGQNLNLKKKKNIS